MSTRAIQEALRLLRVVDDDAGARGGYIAAADAAEKELETVRRAIRFIQEADTSAPVTADVAVMAGAVSALFDVIAREAK